MNYDRWIAHFEINRRNRLVPNWSEPLSIDESKREALALSLAEYQLGDGGGECRLIAHDAAAVRGAHEKAALVVDLWFAEEREHSRLLTHAVERVRGVFVTTTFAFRLFCRIRHWCGVQLEMLILLIVEIVSSGYYRLIQRHCDDEPIAEMCGLILRDEGGHIAFHCDRLTGRYSGVFFQFFSLLSHLLTLACATFLWLGHGRCLRTLGGTWNELLDESTFELSKFLSCLSRAQLHTEQNREFAMNPETATS